MNPLPKKNIRILHYFKVLLKKIIRMSTMPQRIVERAMIVLKMAKYGYRDIAKLQGISVATVRKWARRWVIALAQLVAERKKRRTKKQLIRHIMKTFGDAARSGAPQRFTPEQVARIVQLACTPPSSLGYPIARWSTRELAVAAVKEGIVDKISPSTVHRILNGSDVKPHLVKGWLNAAPENPATFLPRVSRITKLYMEATSLLEDGTHVVCMDEKPGIQANEPLHQTLWVKPGLVERLEQFYRRHGTTCVIGSFDVVTGEIIHATIRRTRKELDFLEHVERTIATDPHAEWVIVTDQLNTHMSESLVCYVAATCGIEKDLGIKGKCGILKSMSSRATFLEDESHRIRFVYTPKHCSWLNQIECWFSILARKTLIRATFTSVADLEQKIREFIEYYNQSWAKPFKWTYTGRPLAVA